MPQKKLLSKIKNFTIHSSLSSGTLVALVVLLAILVYALTSRLTPETPIQTAQASYSSYAGGQVSLDVVYLDSSGNEVSNISLLPSSQLTVRLKYANTGELQAQNVSITSLLPSGFSYLAGTLRNVYNDISVPLPNSLFSGQQLTVSPTAGMYNFGQTSSSGVLDIGKKKFLRVQRCSVPSEDDELSEVFASNTSFTSTNSTSTTCPDQTGGAFISGSSIPLLNRRYLKSFTCTNVSGKSETSTHTSSNTSSASTDPLGNNCSTFGIGVFTSVRDIDLLSGRYARVLKCDHTTLPDEYLLAPTLYATNLASNDATGQNCPTAYSGSTFAEGTMIDLLDIENSEGFIEFSVTTPSSSGCSTLSSTMTSTSFSTVTSSLSCNVKIETAVPVSNGVVAFSKNYHNGVAPVNTLDLPIGGRLTVRLNYINTSNTSVNSLTITDSYPTNIFEYEPNSAKNCYAGGQVCTPLNNSQFTTGTISIAPQAGVYGESNSQTIGSLEAGRDRYLYRITCSNSLYFDSFIAETSPLDSSVVGTCSDYGLTGYTKTSTSIIDTLGKRYLNMVTCEKDGYYDSFVAEASNTSGSSSLLCSSFGYTGYTNTTSFGVDLSQSTHLNMKRCSKSGVFDTYLAQATNTSGESSNTCFREVDGYSSTTAFGHSIYDSQNSYGYIEYQLNAKPEIASGLYGTNATLTQGSNPVGVTLSPITANATDTITIRLICDTINPVGGERNFDLSDAELRTDQDFSCNYTARICPVVFEDINGNRAKNLSEPLFDGTIVELRRQSTNSLLTSLTVNSATTQPQCFDNLASGEMYTIIVSNPPTPYNTVGQNSTPVQATVLILNQFLYLGYTQSSGIITLDASPSVSFPAIIVSNNEQQVTTSVPFVEVNDQRSGNVPWSVSSVMSNFQRQTITNILPINNRFTFNPDTITVIQGNESVITRGNSKTIQSDQDSADIFNTGGFDGSGQYSISVDIDYNVPAGASGGNYQGEITFTLI